MMTACRSNESMQEKAEAEEEKKMMKKRNGVTGTEIFSPFCYDT